LLNVLEAYGRKAASSPHLGRRVRSVRETDLLGKPSRKKVFFEGREVKLHVHPFEIRQFEITIE